MLGIETKKAIATVLRDGKEIEFERGNDWVATTIRETGHFVIRDHDSYIGGKSRSLVKYHDTIEEAITVALKQIEMTMSQGFAPSTPSEVRHIALSEACSSWAARYSGSDPEVTSNQRQGAEEARKIADAFGVEPSTITTRARTGPEQVDQGMNYSEAVELLGLTTPKSLEDNARLAAGMLSRLTASAPLRYKTACRIVIRAAEEVSV